MSFLALQQIDCAPISKEQYRLPVSVLQALSNKGTLILEVALKTALQALEGAVKEHNRRQLECRGCVLCLFPECTSLSVQCREKDRASDMEPTCKDLLTVESESDAVERSWAVSRLCGFYQRFCSEVNSTSQACIKAMAGHCHLKIQECKLESDMDYLSDSPDEGSLLTCGRTIAPVINSTGPKGRIVGGSVTSPGSWPWLVNIRLNGELMCGGVLLGDVWVLTAAHCFNGDVNELHWTVVVGEYDLSKQEDGKMVFQVNRIIIHPKFDQKTFNNDVALVELTNKVRASERAIPVCLPSAPVDPAPSTNCYIAGWGSLYEDGPPSDVVMEASVPVLSQESCIQTLGKEMFTNTMFCAGYLTGGIDSCQGDSGGPLTCQDPLSKQYVLYGITSWGDGCGEKGKPGVYTRVTAFIDWIGSQMKKSNPTLEPSCLELRALSDIQQNNHKSEINSVCSFYKQSCPGPLGPEACTRLAEEKCRQKQRRCELRSYLQILLNLLRKAEDSLRKNMDFLFFTQTIPQFMKQMYSDIFPSRARRDLPEQHSASEELNKNGQTDFEEYNRTETHSGNDTHRKLQSTVFDSLFSDMGPALDDWVSALNSLAFPESVNSLEENVEGKETLGLEEQLLLDINDDEVQELKEQGWRAIHSLKSHLRSEGVLIDDLPVSQNPAGSNLEHLVPDHSQLQKRDLSSINRERKENQGCQHVAEALGEVESVKEKYKWILQIPESELSMKFQEILVDLGSKNGKGLYRARVQVCVAGKSTSFISLVGLENSSFYRTMPGLIALSMDTLKT
ncbi:PREDICTED: serine protease 56 [Nanorana parkeri]|uniref:serine protease 56 n=1 Tax=Nanorana parkeri TaxID=125878 RepID=UPI000854A853|nr:PREDICTED: serine protease 56 [Nanorana parkeri]